MGVKIDQKSIKNEVNMRRPPGLHFCWILVDLGTQLTVKLEWKIEPREDKTGQDRTRQDRTRQDKTKTGTRPKTISD